MIWLNTVARLSNFKLHVFLITPFLVDQCNTFGSFVNFEYSEANKGGYKCDSLAVKGSFVSTKPSVAGNCGTASAIASSGQLLPPAQTVPSPELSWSSGSWRVLCVVCLKCSDSGRLKSGLGN